MIFSFFGGVIENEDTMEDWDQETLEKVVESKKNEYNQNKPTDIVCWLLPLEYTFPFFLFLLKLACLSNF